MTIKWIGAILIIIGCGGVGFSIAAAHRAEERQLQILIGALDYMQCELQYRLTPLPELCRQTAAQAGGAVRAVFTVLADELENQISPDVSCCLTAALSKIPDIPKYTQASLRNLGKTLGRFDLDGQLLGLEAVRQECRRNLDSLTANRETRLRSYQTLGLCAGAALAILFI